MTMVLHLAAVTAEGENRYRGDFFSNGRAAALKRNKRHTLATSWVFRSKSGRRSHFRCYSPTVPFLTAWTNLVT